MLKWEADRKPDNTVRVIYPRRRGVASDQRHDLSLYLASRRLWQAHNNPIEVQIYYMRRLMRRGRGRSSGSRTGEFLDRVAAVVHSSYDGEGGNQKH
jgi:hypothetical protein